MWRFYLICFPACVYVPILFLKNHRHLHCGFIDFYYYLVAATTGVGGFYSKFSGEVEAHNILKQYKGSSQIACGMTCRSLSCFYYTMTKSESPPVCTIYGDEVVGGKISEDVDIWIINDRKALGLTSIYKRHFYFYR